VTGAVAKRYARALFALGGEAGGFEIVGRALGVLAAAFRTPEGRALASDPTIDSKKRRQVAYAIAGRLGLPKMVASFAGVLAEKNRLRSLDAIEREYQRLADRALGQVRARITSAKPVSSESGRTIDEVFARKTGKRVVSEVEVDSALLGGVTVEVEGRVYDGSLRTRLERLRRALAG
jgi:F-type H+-transporting ATPase subunit delta